MLIRLIRNQPQGSAITGRLVINGRWFCNTLERVGYEIPALCYHVIVTQSPKFKRLLPLVTGVPRLPIGGTPSNSQSPIAYRSGIRFHRGTKPEHSTGCILVVADNITTIPTTCAAINILPRPTKIFLAARGILIRAEHCLSCRQIITLPCRQTKKISVVVQLPM